MADVPDLKVRIRDADGKYLAGESDRMWLTDDRLKALVFDYHGHQVAEQLQKLVETGGTVLEIEPLDPGEIYETCDRCNRLGMPFDLIFNGGQFLCRDCTG